MIRRCMIIDISRTHELPKFHYWCWGTMTGITGVFLTILTGLIFVCSLPMVRKSFYNWFSFVHSLYPVFYILMVLHGSGRLVQVINKIIFIYKIQLYIYTCNVIICVAPFSWYSVTENPFHLIF